MNTEVKRAVVIIPAYQPSDALVRTVSQLHDARLDVVVVDDGSGPNYDAIFSQLPEKATLLRHSENKGKGAALKTAYAHVANEQLARLVVTADADGQHSASDIQNLIAVYQKHPGSLLLGVRQFDESHVPLKSRLGNVITRKVLSFLTAQTMTDTQTGLRAFDANILPFMINVSGDRFEYETHVLLACSRAGIPIVEEPIQTIYEEGNPSSHFDPVRDSFAIYKEIAKFMSSSLLAFAIDYVLFIVILQLTDSWAAATSLVVANVAARLVSATVNFSVNKHIVFKDGGKVARGAAQYALLAAGILLANTIILGALAALGIVPYLAKIMTEIVLFVASYVVQKRVIFSQQKGGDA